MNKHYILLAINAEGKSVYIDDVPNGKNCGCFCAECGSALIARQGNIKIHHFAHANGNDNIKCSETALHRLSKEIIVQAKKIPAFVNGKMEFVTVESIEQEKNLGDIKPDLFAVYQGKPIAVEIKVSHAVDDEKFDKVQNHKLTTFEIDLSKVVFENKEDIKKAIFDLNNIRPIYDEQFTEKAIADKKQFIDKNGITKNIINSFVSKCPMNPVLKGQQVQICDINSNVCEKCPFGYKFENENSVQCIGHLYIEFSKNLFVSRLNRRSVTINTPYDWQINITKQKIVNLTELADYFTCITKQRFTVIKHKSR